MAEAGGKGGSIGLVLNVHAGEKCAFGGELRDELRRSKLMELALRRAAPDHSARMIVTGLVRTARITGGSAASNAAARMVSAGSAIIVRSVACTW